MDTRKVADEKVTEEVGAAPMAIEEVTEPVGKTKKEPKAKDRTAKWKFVKHEEHKVSDLYKIEDMTLDQCMELEVFANDMIAFAIKNNGVGLAAPQIGVYKQVFVYKNNQGNWKTCVNPWYTFPKTPTVVSQEGCLTFPGDAYVIKRYKRIQVMYYTFNEKHLLVKKHHDVYGVDSIVYQHEFDHLYGLALPMIGRIVEKPKKEER